MQPCLTNTNFIAVMNEYFEKAKETINRSLFLKTFVTIGSVAAVGVILYNVGKAAGSLIAEWGLF